MCLNVGLPGHHWALLQVKSAGRKGGHKGRARQYTSPEEIDAQLQAEKQKAREEEEQEEGGEGATGDPKKEKKSLDSDESDEDDEDYQQKRKGVEGLIDIENPNRVIQTTKKVTQLDLDGPKELSRREREEIEKQKAKERYMKMHLAGKTEQAKADLARLAIIRKQREEAARKKEEERKAKDEAAMAGCCSISWEPDFMDIWSAVPSQIHPSFPAASLPFSLLFIFFFSSLLGIVPVFNHIILCLKEKNKQNLLCQIQMEKKLQRKAKKKKQKTKTRKLDQVLKPPRELVYLAD
uniref:PDGFA associated protein 1 n=1 Tax=Cyanistes caeruleus TaxID=156563 RepID=A0A8C0VM04_CYACU